MSGSFRFCPQCAAPGSSWVGGVEFRCGQCGFRFFQNVATACGVLLQDQGDVLFLERARAPAEGLWGWPGGFVSPGESLAEALMREVREEIGGELGRPEYLDSYANQYPFAGVTYHTCDLYFRAPLLTDRALLVAEPSEVSRLIWIRPDDVDPSMLAFESLRAIWRSLSAAGFSR